MEDLKKKRQEYGENEMNVLRSKFWKDKQIVKDQINKWSHKNIELLIFKINEIELLIKKNSSISLSVLSDFIIEQASTASN